jgi:putative transcriptional regulator
MIRSRLLILMAERRVRTLSQVARATKLSKPTLYRFASDSSARFDRETLEKLCTYFRCQPGDLLEYVEDKSKDNPSGG